MSEEMKKVEGNKTEPNDNPFAPKKGPRNPADANTITREYFDSILLEERIIDSVEADISMELFGKHFDTPIMMPGLMERGHEGVEEIFTKMNEELATIMNYTCCAKLSDIDESVLYFTK